MEEKLSLAATENRLHLSSSPHIRQGESVSSIMLSVVIALMPAFAASLYFFRWRAMILTVSCVISCLLTEWLITHFLLKRPCTLGDFSALVTAILLAFNLPPQLPWWMAAIGSVFAIGVAKWTFGGLGHNIVNPALAGRAFLMAAYPAAMTSWSKPVGGEMCGLGTQRIAELASKVDGISSATPLAAFTKISAHLDEPELGFHLVDFQEALGNLFIGNCGGCIGETSALALLAGAVFLWYRRIIGFSIPVMYLGTVVLLSWILNGQAELFTSESLIIPIYQLLSGGLLLGALFMATDMVTSPVTTRGRIVFGAGCGLLTFTIRKFGGYPEGVSYSILLMNLVVPLIDRYMRPRMYGKKKSTA